MGCSKPAPPKIGDSCKEGADEVCLDDISRAVCHGGKYVLEHCRVCKQTVSSGLFSQETTSATSGCVMGGFGPEGAACEGKSEDCDGVDLVQCKEGTYHHIPCQGPKGCAHGKSGFSCDTSIGTPGKACFGKNNAGCTLDKKAMVHCIDDEFVLDKSCAGPEGCNVSDEGKISCDVSLANLGAPCINGGACATDFSAVLTCQDHAYAAYRNCRGQNGKCVLSHDEVACNHPELATVGDPCQGEISACSEDHKAWLTCDDGVFALQKKCRLCEQVGTRVECRK